MCYSFEHTTPRTADAIKQEAVKAADKAGDAFRDAKQAVGQWWDKNKDTVKKVAIGVAAAVVIVGATVLTAGAAAGVMGAVAAGTMGVGAAAASMAVTGAAAAGASAIASTAASSSIQHYNMTGSWSGAGHDGKRVSGGSGDNGNGAAGGNGGNGGAGHSGGSNRSDGDQRRDRSGNRTEPNPGRPDGREPGGV